jgi:hypothetical protein
MTAKGRPGRVTTPDDQGIEHTKHSKTPFSISTILAPPTFRAAGRNSLWTTRLSAFRARPVA